MEITIDIDDPLPQFEQLITQVKEAIINGKLKPGDPLPSIRQLANDLELNNKTVAKAYRLLERDSVIETRGYRGTYVHSQANQHTGFDLQEWTRNTLNVVIENLRVKGVTDSEIRNAFSACMTNKAPAARSVNS